MSISTGERIYDVNIKQELALTRPYHRYNPEKPYSTQSHQIYPHIENLNDASSDLILEAQAKAAVHTSTVRKPLGIKKLVTLFPTLLG
jgi:hypothetical protein